MIANLLLSTAMAEITVTYVLPTHHISGQPYTLDIQIFNDGDKVEEIQDLSSNRWAVSFTVEQDGQQSTLRTTKESDAKKDLVTLQPRGLQELRFEVPNAAAWTTGTVNLSIQTPLSAEPYRHEIVIYPHQIEQIAQHDIESSAFIRSDEVLWVHKDGLFVNPQKPRFIHTLPAQSTFGTSLHLGASKHIYWMWGNYIHILPIIGERSSMGLFTTIPWPNGEPMGPSFTDGKGRYMTPIWVNNTSSQGTLYMLIMDRQGRPSFRKLYMGVKPVECIGALSQAGTPILALRTDTTAWLLKLTEVGDPQVDSLPPKILTLHRENDYSNTVDLSFGMSEAQGLFVGLLSKTNPSPEPNTDAEPYVGTVRQFSLQGQSLQTTPFTKPSMDTNTHLTWVDNTPIVSIHNDKELVFWNDTKPIWHAKGPQTYAVRGQHDSLQLWSLKDGALSVEQVTDLSPQETKQ